MIKIKKQSNTRSGRAVWSVFVRSLANTIRSWIVLKVKYPWIKSHGLTRIPLSVDIWAPYKDIVIGDRVQLGPECIIHCDVHFGNHILVGPRVAFFGKDGHRYDIVGKTIWDSPRGDNYKIIVEDDVWIGYGAIILSGVTIGRGSVVAAGSIVTKSIPRYSIVGGVPAKVIGKRFTKEQILEHEKILCNDSNYSGSKYVMEVGLGA